MLNETKFWSKVLKIECGCWEWTGRLTQGLHQGYGAFDVDGKQVGAHRIAYQLCRGPIPSGMHIDHLCRNLACVNPAHLEAVTCKVNILRGIGPSALQAKQTHCLRGHLLDAFHTSVGSHGSRQCKVCRSLRAKQKRGAFFNSKWSKEIV